MLPWKASTNVKTFYRFTGTAGQAIVTRSSAYFFTDSRYWLQAKEQLDSNWTLIKAGAVGQPKDWIDWLVVGYPHTIAARILILVFRSAPRRTRLV